MRAARELLSRMAPDVECNDELNGDAALSEDMRRSALMDTKLHGET